MLEITLLNITNVYVVDFIDLWIFAVLEEFQFKHQINSKQAADTCYTIG